MKAEEVWDKASIKSLLSKSNKAVEKAVTAIYKKQLSDEQRIHETIHRNNVGFNHADARKGSYYATWILKGNHLTGQHLVKARALIMKYSRQLADVANGKG